MEEKKIKTAFIKGNLVDVAKEILNRHKDDIPIVVVDSEDKPKDGRTLLNELCANIISDAAAKVDSFKEAVIMCGKQRRRERRKLERKTK